MGFVFSSAFLSASSSGVPIPVTATSSPGTVVHTSVAMDSLKLWASNVSDEVVLVTVEWGDTGVGSLLCKDYQIPPNTPPVPITSGQPLGVGKVVRVYASSADAVNITGEVLRKAQA